MDKKLVCINSLDCENYLTVGKIYEGKESYTEASYFTVTDDNGNTKDFYSWRFTPIEEWRAQQIDKLLL